MNKYQQLAGNQRSGFTVEDLCVVPDCSYSMDTSDLWPSRLLAAIKAATSLIEVKRRHYPHDRVGLASFAGDGRVHKHLAEVGQHGPIIINALHDLTCRSDTNITAGLNAAERVLCWRRPEDYLDSALSPLRDALSRWQVVAPTPVRQKRLVLLSDGEHLCGPKDELFAAADRLKQANISIATIGIGASPAVVNEEDLKRIASLDPATGLPQYCFIADTLSLIEEFKRQAHHISRIR